MRNGKRVLGVRCWVLVCLPQHLKPNTQHPLIIPHSSFRRRLIYRRLVMRANLVRGVGGTFLALLVIASCLTVAQSQQRRKRTSRRVTHPVRVQPTPELPSEPSVISTADEQQEGTQRRTSTRARTNSQAENEQLRGT